MSATLPNQTVRPANQPPRPDGARHATPANTTPAALPAPAAAPQRWAGIERPYDDADVERLRPSVRIAHTLADHGARRLWELLTSRDYVHALGALTGGQAVQMVRAGLKAIYLSGWQVAADANLAGHDLPRPEPLPGQQRAGGGAAHQQRAAPRRPDRARPRASARAPTGCAPIVADAEAGFGGAAQRLRAHEGDDRGRRRRRPLRGPARLREEVRPHGRQGAGADRAVHPHPGRRAAGRRRDGRADRARRAHRRRRRHAAHERRRRARPPVPHRRAHAGGLLPHHAAGIEPAIARGLAYAPYADLRLVRDLDARPRRGPTLRRGRPRAVPGQDAGLQLLAVVQLEEATSTTPPSPGSSASWARWATSSSSSRWPASTRSTTACSSWRAATRHAA